MVPLYWLTWEKNKNPGSIAPTGDVLSNDSLGCALTGNELMELLAECGNHILMLIDDVCVLELLETALSVFWNIPFVVVQFNTSKVSPIWRQTRAVPLCP